MKDAGASVSVTMNWSESVYCLFLLQVYDESDVRRARFIGRLKEVTGTIYRLSKLFQHCITLKITSVELVTQKTNIYYLLLVTPFKSNIITF